MVNRRFGWHSGSVNCYDLTVDNDLSISGDLSFGDAATDTLTVSGKLDCNGNVDLGSGDDTINVGGGVGDTINLNADLAGASNISLSLTGTGALSLQTGDISTGGDISAVNGVLTGTLGVTGAISSTGSISSQGAGSFDGDLDANALAIDGADQSLTYTGTNTTAVGAWIFPDDTYIADANGSLGSTAGFVVCQIGSTQFKLQTYAMS